MRSLPPRCSAGSATRKLQRGCWVGTRLDTRPAGNARLLESVTDAQWQLRSFDLPSVRVTRVPVLSVACGRLDSDAPVHNRYGQWIVIDDEIVHDPGDYSAWIAGLLSASQLVGRKVIEPIQPEAILKQLGRTQTERTDRRRSPSVIECIDIAPRPQGQQFHGYILSEQDCLTHKCARCGTPSKPGAVCHLCGSL